MRSLVSIAFVIAAVCRPVTGRAEPCVGCPTVDDANTRVVPLGRKRWRVEMFYDTGTRFLRGSFRAGSTSSSVHWRPVGVGTVYYSSGKKLARASYGRSGGVASYWFADGDLFAKVQISDGGPRVVMLGRALRRHPLLQSCKAGNYYAQGPHWPAASSAKHYAGLTQAFTLYCGAPATGTFHSSWYSNGNPMRVRVLGATPSFRCFDEDGSERVECEDNASWLQIVKPQSTRKH